MSRETRNFEHVNVKNLTPMEDLALCAFAHRKGHDGLSSGLLALWPRQSKGFPAPALRGEASAERAAG
jgi:hypothetical protein